VLSGGKSFKTPNAQHLQRPKLKLRGAGGHQYRQQGMPYLILKLCRVRFFFNGA